MLVPVALAAVLSALLGLLSAGIPGAAALFVASRLDRSPRSDAGFLRFVSWACVRSLWLWG